jgi:hypothetical protein
MWMVIQDLASAIDEVDVVKFTDIVKEYDSMSRIVSSLPGMRTHLYVFS